MNHTPGNAFGRAIAMIIAGLLGIVTILALILLGAWLLHLIASLAS